MEKLNRTSYAVLVALSLLALLTVLTGYLQPPQTDEGTGAHIFQLSIMALVPVIILFVATADWRQPLQIALRVTPPVIALVLAFGGVYYLDHLR